MPVEWMTQLIDAVADQTGAYPFMVKGVVAVVLVCLLCGAVGALVVGNRMAFFSDAMAHCAVAGVALGGLTAVVAGVGPQDPRVDDVILPAAMVLFGALVGVGIVYVREQTTLAADTVIGVFFALAIGLGAMLAAILGRVSAFNAENFFFGNLVFVPYAQLVYLAGLVLAVGGFLLWRYNGLAFGSFSPSLARTRRVGLRLNNYLFILVLALVVNLSIRAVGALLINGLLVVPAAAAAQVSRNLRQMFWLTLAFAVGSGLGGYFLSTRFAVTVGGERVPFGPSGTIVVVTVGVFVLSVLAAAVRGRLARRAGPRPAL
ncbi:MAG: metal ABC transporter permease [Gemmataceae bacterium]|nr:metal ABC transporter permease [Gemmataceae bacterium]